MEIAEYLESRSTNFDEPDEECVGYYFLKQVNEQAVKLFSDQMLKTKLKFGIY